MSGSQSCPQGQTSESISQPLDQQTHGQPDSGVVIDRNIRAHSGQAMSEVREQARRSMLLIGLSYPLFIAGIVLLFTAMTVPGAVLLGSGVFLIGINELCVYIARTGPAPRGMDR